MLADRVRPAARLQGPREWALLAGVLTVAPLVPLLMRLPLPLVERVLSARRPRLARRVNPERVAVVVETAQQLGRPGVRAGCLTRGVTLFWLLRDPGADGGLRLCFGLGSAAEDFSGHCWLERDHSPFLERVDPRSRFPEQYSLPSGSRP